MSEPTRLPVFLRGWRGGNQARAIIVIATLALATSATAMIGQTPEQVMQGARQDNDTIAMQWEMFGGKPQLRVQYRDGAHITHLFGTNRREILWNLDTPKRLNNQDLAKIQRVYRTTWRDLKFKNSNRRSWLSASKNLQMALSRDETTDKLTIFDLNRDAEIKEVISKLPETDEPKEEGLKPARQAPVAPTTTQDDEPDCLIIAAEKNAKLKKAGLWSRIARYNENTLAPGGHAAVFYQPTEGSDVCIYDKNFGSLELPTKSHDLNDIMAALNQLLGGGYKFQYTRWIGGEAESEIRKAKTVIEWSGLPDGAQNLARVYVKKYGVSALLPTDLFPDAKKLSSSDESFLQGKSWSGQTTLTFSSVREPLGKVYAECATEHSPQAPSKTVHYKVLRPTWFVVSGDLGPEADSSLGFYTKGVKKDSFVVLMHFQYREDDFPFSEEAFTAMSRGFDGH